MPPQDLAIESAVLGAILIESGTRIIDGIEVHGAIHEVKDHLMPEHFFSDQNRIIYKTILDMGGPVDMLTVRQALKKEGKLDKVGGSHYLAELTTKVHSSANIVQHSRILAELYLKRQIIAHAKESEHQAFSEGSDPFILIESGLLSLNKLLESVVTGERWEHVSEMYGKTAQAIYDRKEGLANVPGIMTGLKAFDKLVRGFQPHEFSIIMARPGQGKTSFALQCLLWQAQAGVKVGFISLEMPIDQLLIKLLSNLSGISTQSIAEGSLSNDEFIRMTEYGDRLIELPIFVNVESELTLSSCLKLLRKAKEYQIQIVYLDFVQLLSKDQQMPDVQFLNEVAEKIKRAAKDLGIAVVLLAQLNRECEKRDDKRPIAADLKGSGRLEELAYTIVGLYNQEFYEGDVLHTDFHQIELIVSKARGAQPGTAVAEFNKHTQTFKDYEDHKTF